VRFFPKTIHSIRCQLAILPVACLLVSPCMSAATFYVAKGGNDADSGSYSAPFRTLQRAVDGAYAGDTVIVRNGVYGHENSVTGGDSSDNNFSAVVLHNSGSAADGITIKAENKWGAYLDCENICDSYFNLYNASYVTIQDFVITHGYKEGIHSNDAAHHITLRGNQFAYIANRWTSTPLGLDGMYTSANCHDFVIDGNVFHDIGRLSANWLDHGLYLHGWNYSITNNTFYNIPHGWSIQAADGLSNVDIANNTFAWGNGNGQDGQIMLWNTQSNLTIRNNIFYMPIHYAITRYASTIGNCSFSNNVVYGAATMADSSGCSDSSTTWENPNFVNAASAPYDFHVQAPSAVGKGVTDTVLTAVTDVVSPVTAQTTEPTTTTTTTTTYVPPYVAPYQLPAYSFIIE
jgi:hypothetical protein